MKFVIHQKVHFSYVDSLVFLFLKEVFLNFLNCDPSEQNFIWT